MNTFRVTVLAAIAAIFSSAGLAPVEASQPGRPNVLLITADDMNYDAPGVTGCRVPDITPNLDRLASQGMRFVNGHVTIAVCQPSRSVLMTGRYPHRNGAEGFEPIDVTVPTLIEHLQKAGYCSGILGKVRHLKPDSKFPWDMAVPQMKLGFGRDWKIYYQHAKSFFDQARSEGKPFFLMANSHDPHRPFAGSQQETRVIERLRKKQPDYQVWPLPSRVYRPDEVQVPAFLPDIPDVHKEIAQYYSSVHRCDQTIGEILRALRESGMEDNTIVMFLSDNGMALPFAKTNCYLTSTRTPWIVRWPGHVRPGQVDETHFISGIDFMPTILEMVGAKAPEGMDGNSFLPVLTGHKQAGRDHVYTVFHQTAGKRDYPMRCVQTAKFGYIFNDWSDGKTVFLNESQSGLSFKAMQAAGEADPQIAARVKLFQYRVPEEFYDMARDPACLNNLIGDPDHADDVQRFRRRMLGMMEKTGDPLKDAFIKHTALATAGTESRRQAP